MEWRSESVLQRKIHVANGCCDPVFSPQHACDRFPPLCAQHDAGPEHPEAGLRLDEISNQVIASGLDFVARHYEAPAAERSALELVHTPEYLDRLMSLSPASGYVNLDGDTVLSPATVAAAAHAAGAGILGVDLILRGEAPIVFCPVRPPGHHAEPAVAMGSCLLNNVAVAAKYALEKQGLSRVAIIDFDAHHGNGTEVALCNDDRLLYCSSFQHRFYPHTGVDSPCANLAAVPLRAGTQGTEFRAAAAVAWFDRLAAFRPEFVIFSAGFDAHILDDMSGLGLREADFALITAEVRRVAAPYCGDRFLSILEGGYEPGALARSVLAHLKALMT